MNKLKKIVVQAMNKRVNKKADIDNIKVINYDNLTENLKGTFSWKELLDAIKKEGYEFDKKYYEMDRPFYHIMAFKNNKEYEFMLAPSNSVDDICGLYQITETGKEYKTFDEFLEKNNIDMKTKANKMASIISKEILKSAKVNKKAFYEDEKAALAKYLNINENDITKKEDNFYFGLPEFTTKSGEEYSVSASESVIKDAVAESMENLFNDLGLDEFQEKVLPYVGNFDRYFSVSESKFYDQAREELENVDEIEDPTEEQIEKKQQEIIDSYGSAEEFFIEFGDDYVKEMLNYGDASIDFKTMAEDVINEYGAGHELAGYDNETNEVEYNGKTYYIFRQQ